MTKKLLSPAMESRKKELQAELKTIATIEEQEIINRHYPEIKKKYEGKYFKYRNAYNSKEKWWKYSKVTKINPDDVYDTGGNGVTSHYTGISFQTTTNGEVNIEKEKYGYIHSLGEQIPKREFDAAWRATLKQIRSIGLKTN